MGIEYEHVIIPSPQTRQVTAESIAALIGDLYAQQWLPTKVANDCVSIKAQQIKPIDYRSIKEALPAGFDWRVVRFPEWDKNQPHSSYLGSLTDEQVYAYKLLSLEKSWNDESRRQTLLEQFMQKLGHPVFSEEKAIREVWPESGVKELPVPDSLTSKWLEEKSTLDLVLQWNIPQLARANVSYPFKYRPIQEDGSAMEDEYTYFSYKLILSQDYVEQSAENVDPLDATNCRDCGEQLRYDVGYAAGVPGARIRSTCPKCGTPFETDESVEVRNGWTNEPQSLPGGVIHCFALIIDCGKAIPSGDLGDTTLAPHFRALVQKHLGATYEVGLFL